MTLQIPDDILKAANLDERGMLVELACRLFDTDRLSLSQAARLAGMERGEFEETLHDRGIAIYRYDEDEFRRELAAIAKTKDQGR